MLTSAEQLKQIIDYQNIPQAPAALKPGFYFNSQDYPLLESLKIMRNNISFLGDAVVMQDVVLKDNDTTLIFYFFVSSTSCKELREKFIEFASIFTSMPIDAFKSGPVDIGEFTIIPIQYNGDDINMIHFVRNNIGITVFLSEGKFHVESLTKQIDENIQNMKDYNQDTIKSVSPLISKILAPDHDILLNSTFETSIVISENSDQSNLLYFFQYDDEMINQESQDGQRGTFTALSTGKTIINYTAVNRKNLLSTSKSLEINIVDK